MPLSCCTGIPVFRYTGRHSCKTRLSCRTWFRYNIEVPRRPRPSPRPSPRDGILYRTRDARHAYPCFMYIQTCFHVHNSVNYCHEDTRYKHLVIILGLFALAAPALESAFQQHDVSRGPILRYNTSRAIHGLVTSPTTTRSTLFFRVAFCC